jgi:hypothetical protein
VRVLPFNGTVTVLAGVALLLLFGAGRPARAQILFFDSDATINTDISGNDVVVGSVNPNPFTVTVADGAKITNNSSVDGHFGLETYRRSTLDVLGGDIEGDISAFDSSTVNLAGGTAGIVTAFGTSRVNLNGGTAITLDSNDDSLVNVKAGSVFGLSGLGNGTFHVTGGTVSGDIFLDGNSLLRVDGGTLLGVTTAANTSVVGIFGGAVEHVDAFDSSAAFILGGRFSNQAFAAFNDGVVNVYGNGLTLSNPVAGDLYGFSGVYYTLTGTLAKGQALTTSYFDEGGTLGDPVAGINLINGVTLAPEPGTLGLLACGVALLVMAVYFGGRSGGTG